VDGNATFVFGADLRSTINLGNAAPSSIWVVPARGGPAVRVTDDHFLNTSPAWLPEQRALLFVSNREGDRDVYRVDLDDGGRPLGEPVRVTAGLGAHTIGLSRDGRRMTYSVFRSTSNIWSLPIPARGPVSDSGARPITSGSQSIEGLAVSPDGAWLAFDSDRKGNQDIYKVPPNGGAPVQLTADSADEFMPHWSPDGEEIAFYSFLRDGTRQVKVMSAAGGRARPVVASPRDQRFPGWSPDGKSLVFGSDETGQHELYVVSRSGRSRWGAARRLTSAGGTNGRWSPDGRQIVYTRPDGIWTIGPSAGPPRRVLGVDSAAHSSLGIAQWSADGRTIFYKAFDRQGRASIWSVPAAGGTPQLLVRLDDPKRQSPRPEFATGGQRFYFTIAERVSDVWTMELSTAAR
jgi:Tol biopolymer transport system component